MPVQRATAEQRGAIIALASEGMPKTAIAERVGFSRISVHRILRAHHEHGSTPRPETRGRKRKLSPRARRHLRTIALRPDVHSVAQVAEAYHSEGVPPVSRHTVRRALQLEGVKCYKRRRRPALSAKHRAARLEWAKKHLSLDLSHWKRVLFTDETKINRIGCDGQATTLDHQGRPPGGKRVRQTTKFGGGGLLMWAGICYEGVSNVAIFGTTMSSDEFIAIQAKQLVPSARRLFGKKGNWTLQMDNDPKHTSAKATAWYAKRRIKILPWPSCSPDLNPIEHYWFRLKQEIHAMGVPSNMQQLQDNMRAAHFAMQQSQEGLEFIRNLVASMPRRCQAVIDANGGHTTY